MSNKTLIFLGIGAGVIFYFLSKGQAGKNLKISFKNIKFGKFTGLTLPVTANFEIANPTNTPLTIDNIIGDIFVNNKNIASVKQLQSFTIKGNSEIIYPVNVNTGLFDVINVVRNLIKERKKFMVTFKGSASSTGILLPIENTIFQL